MSDVVAAAAAAAAVVHAADVVAAGEVPRAESPTRGALPPATWTAKRSRKCVRRPKVIAVVREEEETIGKGTKIQCDGCRK